MIPVRVPVDAPTYQAGGERTLQPANPMYGTLCPVCDEFLLDAPVVLVYVGMMPADRERPRFATGGAVVIHASCRGKGAQVEGEPRFHHYLSTACWHEHHDGEPGMHAQCRLSCKSCDQSCSCPNHPENDDRPAPPPWVDQARDGFIRLLAVVRENGIDLSRAEPDLNEAVRYDPDWFWARGEVQPAGEWHPTSTNEGIPDV